MLFHLEDPAGAAGHYRMALALRPQAPAAHYELGLALTRLGEYGQAVNHLETALAIEPGHPAIIEALRIARQGLP
jgi:tetratricopeptide (TPR) repeat protein